MKSSSLILNNDSVNKKLNRITHQIIEDNFDEKELNEAKTHNMEINNFLIKSFFTNLQIINFIVVSKIRNSITLI